MVVLKSFIYKESFLERAESYDSNRICDNGRGQFIARQEYFNFVRLSFWLKKVEKYQKDNYLNLKKIKFNVKIKIEDMF